MNVFHWHLTDSHSFPIELKKYPDTTGQMVNYGAYDKDQFYTVEQVREIVAHANENGETKNTFIFANSLLGWPSQRSFEHR